MDGYLHIILLVVAAIIVLFIVFEAWYRRRQFKKQDVIISSSSSTLSMDPDQVLGLEEREPTITIRSADASQLSQTNSYDSPAYRTQPKPSNMLNDLLIITVVPEGENQFGSYDLLQAITATGLQFGEMNIFHYKLGHEKLFSLSSATEPGDFNLDNMGNFTCSGLTFFANLREVSNPSKVFEIMLRCAEQLAEDLGGELRAGTRKPWNEEAFHQFHQKVLQYQLMK